MRILKTGEYSKPEPVFHLAEVPDECLDTIDHEIWQRLSLAQKHFPLEGMHGAQLMPLLVQTERCHFINPRTQILQLGEPREAQLEWITERAGKQRLHCRAPGSSSTVLWLQPFWYVDAEKHLCGELITPIDSKIVRALLKAPPMTPEQIHQIYVALSQKPATDTATQPTIELFVAHAPKPYVLAKIQHASTTQQKNLRKSFTPFDHKDYPDTFLVSEMQDEKTLLHFHFNVLPQLIKQHWKVQFDESYPYQTEEHIQSWYCDIKNTTKNDWLEFEMGIMLDQKRVNLLPILVEFIQNQLRKYSLEHLLALPEDKVFFIPLPNGRLLPLPMQRLRQILLTLTELYDQESLSGKNTLRMNKIRALQLANLEHAAPAKKMTWLGLTQFADMAHKIQTFKGIKKIAVPANLNATLRPYQLEGLQWLQFLREFGFGGILADDMGLGKTIQALAHILVEKNARRLNKPCLIITPTSLLINWQREAQNFAPSLKTLVLHGQERKIHHDTLTQYDIIITTYALLTRDQEILTNESYHLLILDEAQYIKNAKTQANHIVRQLDANQRLCLTGTPIENHLGELWAIFNFLLPGLLGEHAHFQRTFRLPIEKEHDVIRQEALKQRIAPFFLRRTKHQVAKELPDKIEMLRPVALTDIQRELYESVRIALHSKINAAIQEQGIARNQMMILEALLKLRQICCDPRLLKMSHVATTPESSAKLQLLIDTLPNLIGQGRRILLFSQFTEMLELIEQSCKKLNIKYVKLTGQTTNRQKPVDAFQAEEVPLFLISLKAGGVGLNLTAADTVIHYDPWWNPAVENQATDRAHRIGQDKTVFVYKLITTGTVEEKMLAMQQQKQSLFEKTITAQTQPFSFTKDELEKLFAPLS